MSQKKYIVSVLNATKRLPYQVVIQSAKKQQSKTAALAADPVVVEQQIDNIGVDQAIATAVAPQLVETIFDASVPFVRELPEKLQQIDEIVPVIVPLTMGTMH